ncbi:MAG: GntR family transcriptional regulator [Anaerolineales bacterium]
MNQTDAEKAYREIKERIVRTKLPPGSVVNEADLMNDLKFGRTPIREALKQLQIEGLVVVKPRRGIFVSDLSITDLSKIFEVRIVLEGLAARLATERITPHQLERLQALADQYRKSSPSRKEQLIQLDSEFHSLIAEATHNHFLQTNLEHYYNLSLRIWYLALPQTSIEDINVEVHLDITEAISSGDAKKAEREITQHIKDFHTTIKKYL